VSALWAREASESIKAESSLELIPFNAIEADVSGQIRATRIPLNIGFAISFDV
jgi:hypothetical protein